MRADIAADEVEKTAGLDIALVRNEQDPLAVVHAERRAHDAGSPRRRRDLCRRRVLPFDLSEQVGDGNGQFGGAPLQQHAPVVVTFPRRDIEGRRFGQIIEPMKQRLQLARVEIEPAHLRPRRPPHGDQEKQRPEFDAARADHFGDGAEIVQHMARHGGVNLRLQTKVAAPVEDLQRALERSGNAAKAVMARGILPSRLNAKRTSPASAKRRTTAGVINGVADGVIATRSPSPRA